MVHNVTNISKNSQSPLNINLLKVWFVVLNSNFNNISAISWRLALLMEETEGPGENMSQVTDKSYLCPGGHIGFLIRTKAQFVLKVNSVNIYVQLEYCMRWISIICLHLRFPICSSVK